MRRLHPLMIYPTESGYCRIYTQTRFCSIATADTVEVARRIADCWNACLELSDEELANGVVPKRRKVKRK